MRPLIGFIAGVALTYLFGAFVGASFNPVAWGVFWRFMVVTFAIFWGAVGAALADATR